jgi:pimeloyl-ACP methyl ester carboxylesterase
MQWPLVLLVLLLMPLSVRAQQQTAIAAQEYRVPSTSAKDGSPLTLAVSEKYHEGRDPNIQAAGGRIVLLTHGSSFSGQVGVDVQVPGVPPEHSFSLMDQLALRGYDVWTLAYQNYGRSDHHDCGLCVTTEAAARDIEATTQFIRRLRNVDRLHLIAWSWGAQAGGLVAQRHPEWVNRLVLNAPLLDLQEGAPPPEQFRTNNEAGLMRVFHPTTQVPAVVHAFLQAALQWDLQPPNGVLVDWRTDPMKMDPRQLTMPTLVIYGADDVITPLSGPNVYPFFRDLAAADKKFVAVPDAGHSLFMEQPRERWYQEVLLHLESGNSPLPDGGR